MSDKATFEAYAGEILNNCIEVFEERAGQYGDTMAECQWLIMKSVAKRLGLYLDDNVLRLLAIAGLCDIKYARFLGGYKEDSCLDMINYLAFLAKDMQQINKPV